MTKLIRLTTTDQSAVFDNVFNEDITVKPYSKIALQSMTAEIDTSEIIIDGLNNTITYKVSDSSPLKSARLDNGVYTSANFGDLFSDATTKLNLELKNSSADVGFQWNVFVDKNKKANFYIKRGDVVKPEAVEFEDKVGFVNTIQVAGKVNTFGANSLQPVPWECFLFGKTTMAKGSSCFRTRLDTINNSSAAGFGNGMIIGLTRKLLNEDSKISIQDIAYGVQCFKQGLAYSAIIEGALAPTNCIPIYFGVEDKRNDYMGIETFGGTARLVIYRNNDTIQLYSGSFPTTETDLYPVIVYLDGVSESNNIRWTDEPTFDDSATKSTADDPIEAGTNFLMPSLGNSKATKTLSFGSPELAIVFGFKSTVLQSLVPVCNFNFIADNFFNMSDFADSFVIELLDIPVDAYDGYSNQRRNILATVVQTDVIRERLTHTAYNPIFLSINNAQPMSLRRIRARILREDLTSVPIVGIAQITLLIDEK